MDKEKDPQKSLSIPNPKTWIAILISKEAFDHEFRRYEKEAKEILGENFTPTRDWIKDAFWQACEFRSVKFLKGTLQGSLDILRKRYEEKIH